MFSRKRKQECKLFLRSEEEMQQVVENFIDKFSSYSHEQRRVFVDLFEGARDILSFLSHGGAREVELGSNWKMCADMETGVHYLSLIEKDVIVLSDLNHLTLGKYLYRVYTIEVHPGNNTFIATIKNSLTGVFDVCKEETLDKLKIAVKMSLENLERS